MQIPKSVVAPILIVTVLAVAWPGLTEETKAEEVRPVVLMQTSLGPIKIELWYDKAPVTVKNFLRYTDEGFYGGTIFHRVIKGFMIQGGGFTTDMKGKNTHEPIKNEASPHLKNEQGTIAMARTQAVHSATSQFFINLVDNDFLNQRDETARGYGYAVFGRVIEGMEVVHKIGKVKTTTRGPYRDVPVTPVVVERISRVNKKE